jgi:ubiquinone/menaquinone biosynthesis C-methylase UbiE
MYLAAHGRSIVLVDRSLQMLRRGVRRLDSARNVLPAGITVLHADAAALPVRAGSFTTILSLNVLHVPCDRRAIVAEWARTLVPGHGRLSCRHWCDPVDGRTRGWRSSIVQVNLVRPSRSTSCARQSPVDGRSLNR